MGSVLWLPSWAQACHWQAQIVDVRFIVEGEFKLKTAPSLLSFFGQIYVVTSDEV